MFLAFIFSVVAQAATIGYIPWPDNTPANGLLAASSTLVTFRQQDLSLISSFDPPATPTVHPVPSLDSGLALQTKILSLAWNGGVLIMQGPGTLYWATTTVSQLTGIAPRVFQQFPLPTCLGCSFEDIRGAVFDPNGQVVRFIAMSQTPPLCGVVTLPMNTDMSWSSVIPSSGGTSGELGDPRAIALDPQGQGALLVADPANNAITIITPLGTFLDVQFRVGGGQDPDSIDLLDVQLQQPHCVVTAGDQYVYFAELGNNRIRKYDGTDPAAVLSIVIDGDGAATNWLSGVVSLTPWPSDSPTLLLVVDDGITSQQAVKVVVLDSGSLPTSIVGITVNPGTFAPPTPLPPTAAPSTAQPPTTTTPSPPTPAPTTGEPPTPAPTTTTVAPPVPSTSEPPTPAPATTTLAPPTPVPSTSEPATPAQSAAEPPTPVPTAEPSTPAPTASPTVAIPTESSTGEPTTAVSAEPTAVPSTAEPSTQTPTAESTGTPASSPASTPLPPAATGVPKTAPPETSEGPLSSAPQTQPPTPGPTSEPSSPSSSSPASTMQPTVTPSTTAIPLAPTTAAPESTPTPPYVPAPGEPSKLQRVFEVNLTFANAITDVAVNVSNVQNAVASAFGLPAYLVHVTSVTAGSVLVWSHVSVPQRTKFDQLEAKAPDWDAFSRYGLFPVNGSLTVTLLWSSQWLGIGGQVALGFCYAMGVGVPLFVIYVWRKRVPFFYPPESERPWRALAHAFAVRDYDRLLYKRTNERGWETVTRGTVPPLALKADVEKATEVGLPVETLFYVPPETMTGRVTDAKLVREGVPSRLQHIFTGELGPEVPRHPPQPIQTFTVVRAAHVMNGELTATDVKQRVHEKVRARPSPARGVNRNDRPDPVNEGDVELAARKPNAPRGKISAKGQRTSNEIAGFMASPRRPPHIGSHQLVRAKPRRLPREEDDHTPFDVYELDESSPPAAVAMEEATESPTRDLDEVRAQARAQPLW